MVNSATDTKTRDITVEKVLETIRGGGTRLKGLIAQIRNRFEAELAITGDRHKAKKAVEALKKELPGVTFSGRFSERAGDKLIEHSGCLSADLDSLGSQLPEIRKKLQASPYVSAMFLSPTAGGLKVIVRVPADHLKHEGSFRAVQKHFRELCGVEIDESGKDVSRLCFMSYDSNLYENRHAIEIAPLPEKPKAPITTKTYSNGKPTKAQIREMLAVIPKRPDYHDWIKVVSAVGDALPDVDEAIGVLNEWSEEERTGEYAEKLKHRLKDVHVGTLIHLARERGWVGAPNVQPRATGDVKLQPLSSVSMLPVRFVDKPLFQVDAFHLLVGKKNAGKGTFLSAIAARFTRGELGEKKNVIWIAAGEDSLSLDVRPRIEAAEGDVTRVYYPPLVPKLPAEVGLLQKWAEDLGEVGLIVLDPVSGMVPIRFNSHLDSDVRPTITPLNELADSLKCVVVGVRHLKKNASEGALESVLGGIDWVNVPRAVLAIVWDETDDIRYVQVKAGNRVPGRSESRGFRIVGADIVPGGEPVAKAVFIEGPGKDVDELLSQDNKTENHSKTKRAAIRILDLLEANHSEAIKQDTLFGQVAEELKMSPGTIKTKAYFGDGLLHDLGLVESYKEKGTMKGGWFVKRSDLPRPREFFAE
jgi:hypothetical protein